MKQMTAKIDETNQVLVLSIPMQEAMSASGKSIVIASTHGNQRTDLTYKGKPVVVGLNAYVSR